MTEEHLGSKLFHYIDDEVRNNAQYYLQFLKKQKEYRTLQIKTGFYFNKVEEN